jgi:hypothetical protein
MTDIGHSVSDISSGFEVKTDHDKHSFDGYDHILIDVADSEIDFVKAINQLSGVYVTAECLPSHFIQKTDFLLYSSGQFNGLPNDSSDCLTSDSLSECLLWLEMPFSYCHSNIIELDSFVRFEGVLCNLNSKLWSVISVALDALHDSSSIDELMKTCIKPVFTSKFITITSLCEKRVEKLTSVEASIIFEDILAITTCSLEPMISWTINVLDIFGSR